jgi:hypothetical protein
MDLTLHGVTTPKTRTCIFIHVDIHQCLTLYVGVMSLSVKYD